MCVVVCVGVGVSGDVTSVPGLLVEMRHRRRGSEADLRAQVFGWAWPSLSVPTTFPAVTLEQDSTGPGFINPTNPSQISLHPHKTPLDPFLNTPKGLPHAWCLIVDLCFHRAETKDGENAQRSVITARPQPAALSWVTAGRYCSNRFFSSSFFFTLS